MIGNLTVQGSAQIQGTLTADGFPTTLQGQYNCVSDGKVATFDYYVNPGFMDFNDAVQNTPTGQHAVWCVPRDITITKLEARSTGIDGAAVAITMGLVYGADINAVNSPVFGNGTVTNAGFVRTGLTEIPAGSFLAMYFSGLNSAGTTYNSWTVTYH